MCTDMCNRPKGTTPSEADHFFAIHISRIMLKLKYVAVHVKIGGVWVIILIFSKLFKWCKPSKFATLADFYENYPHKTICITFLVIIAKDRSLSIIYHLYANVIFYCKSIKNIFVLQISPPVQVLKIWKNRTVLYDSSSSKFRFLIRGDSKIAARIRRQRTHWSISTETGTKMRKILSFRKWKLLCNLIFF